MPYTGKTSRNVLRDGVNCYVFDSPAPVFMRIQGGQENPVSRSVFLGVFFIENDISLPDSFWQDAKNSIGPDHSPCAGAGSPFISVLSAAG
ncbi:MAG: hypothetical protein ACLR23_06035 [Clostridia bacterium]